MRLVAPALALTLIAPATLASDADQWRFAGVQPDLTEWRFMASRLPIAKSQIDHYAAILALDEAQKSALDTLLESLAAQDKVAGVAFTEASADVRARAQITRQWQAQQVEQAELSDKFREQRDKRIDSFFDDLRLILTSEQDARWSIVERDRRRMSTLVKFACFDDEAIDLVSAVEALDISDDRRAAIKPILDRYAESLDPVLIERNRKSESLGQALLEYEHLQAHAYDSTPGRDAQKVMKAQQKLAEKQVSLVTRALEVRDAAARVRDVNRQFMDELGKAIPSTAIDDWKKVTKPGRRSDNFWDTYNRAEMLFKTLDSLDNMKSAAEMRFLSRGSDQASDYLLILRAVEPLTPEQRRTIDAIHDDYTAAIERLDGEPKPAEQKDSEEHGALIPTPEGSLRIYRIDPDNPNQNSYAYFNRSEDPERAKKRAAIEQDAVDRLRNVLTMNQRALVARY